LDTRRRVTTAHTVSLWTSASTESSRYGVYLRRLQDSFPGQDLRLPSLAVGGWRLHNPLWHLSRPLIEQTKAPLRTRLVPAHGDLHPGNVLVVGSVPVIIDYGLADLRSPVGTDSARLFGGIVRNLLSEILPPQDLVLVLLALLGLEKPPATTDTPAGRAWRLLDRIQKETFEISGEGSSALWPVHLHGYAFVGLKWAAEHPEQYRACGLLAAAALTCLLGWPKAQAGRGPSAVARSRKQPAEHAAGRDAEPAAQRKDIKPEGPAEILTLVARFAGSASYDATARIYGELADHVFEVIPEIGRVERIEEVVAARQEAIALAERYQASMVVWGTYDDLGIRPRYEVTRDSRVLQKSMIQLDQATRHQLKERYDTYITTHLASEITFLSLRAIGNMCLLNLNYEAALNAFKRALALVPDPERVRSLAGADIYQSMVGIYISLKQYEDALAANAAARELNPDDILNQLQLLLLKLLAEKRTSDQMIEDLCALLRERLENSSVSSEEREGFTKLLALLAAKSPSDLKKMAEDTAKEMSVLSARHTREFSKDVMTHLVRAQRSSVEEHFQNSLTECRKALRLNPRCAPALVLKAYALAVLDRIPEALRELQHAERISPSYEAIYFIRSGILTEGGKYREGLAEIEKALALGVPFQLGFLQWGKAMLGVGQGDEMMVALKDAPIDPAQSSLFLLLSRYHRLRKNYDEALRQANQGIALDSQGAESSLYQERAQIYAEMGHFGPAIEDVRRAAKRAPPHSFSRRKAEEYLQELLLAIDESAASA
jgi:tetratricopeptide (TPR) repeat protein